MKYTPLNWPYSWFGSWREFGEGYENFPSVKLFIDPKRNAEYNKEKLIEYLSEGPAVVATSRIAFPPLFQEEVRKGSVSYKTDGKKFWLDSICDYILCNNLVIPEKWYNEILANDFKLPDNIDLDKAVKDFLNAERP